MCTSSVFSQTLGSRVQCPQQMRRRGSGTDSGPGPGPGPGPAESLAAGDVLDQSPGGNPWG